MRTLLTAGCVRAATLGSAAAVVLTVVLAAATAFGEEIVIDDAVPGTVYDAILDGFPGLSSYDGAGDFGNNALGVAKKAGATEERAIAEFPLGGLGGIDADSIASATLTFNVDDVVATFGPGTGFDGTASSTIDVHDFAGDGMVTLSDFGAGSGPPAAVADTIGHGVITDATLQQTGPIFFDVDVTEAVRTRVADGDMFAGFVLSTDDDQSGTSIDNLGEAAHGPPGVRGSRMPYLTIALEIETTTTTSTTREPAGLCGDANDDGKVTAGDALKILRFAVGSGACAMQLCDADGNTKVNAGDALRVLRAAVGEDVDMMCA